MYHPLLFNISLTLSIHLGRYHRIYQDGKAMICQEWRGIDENFPEDNNSRNIFWQGF